MATTTVRVFSVITPLLVDETVLSCQPGKISTLNTSWCNLAYGGYGVSELCSEELKRRIQLHIIGGSYSLLYALLLC